MTVPGVHVDDGMIVTITGMNDLSHEGCIFGDCLAKRALLAHLKQTRRRYIELASPQLLKCLMCRATAKSDCMPRPHRNDPQRNEGNKPRVGNSQPGSHTLEANRVRDRRKYTNQ